MRRSPRPLLPGQKAVLGDKEVKLGQAMHGISDLSDGRATYDIYLQGNLTDTNREPDEPTLLIGREPHQVRSLADSTIRYTLDQTTKHLKISLENPVMRPEYKIDSVAPVTAHKLCLNCFDALNYFCRYREQQAKTHGLSSSTGKWTTKLLPQRGKSDKKSGVHLPNCVVHHANLFSLLAQAKIGKCHICGIIHRRLDRWDLDLPQYEDYRLELAFPQQNASGSNENDLLVFAMVRSDTKKEPIWNWSVLLELRLWPEDMYLHHFQARLTREDLGPGQYPSMSPVKPSANDSPLTRGIVKSWVRKCMANENGKHVECNKQDHAYLPTRLLDVKHAAEKSYLRVVCPQDDPSRFEKNRKYATLSHCWGSWGAAENPNLTMENLEVRKTKGLSCDALPKTFRDALEVAGWLNISYLWIDSLCIIQDSRSDWIHEASLMHHTYQSSTINISASHGTDSRSGLFVERDPLYVTPQQLRAPTISKSWYVTSDNVFGWTTVSPAFSRAWIHRERQLAPRILHFMSGEVVWECSGTGGSSFASETLPGGAPFKQLWNGNSKYKSTSEIVKSKQGKQRTYALWNELCETFSTKELTVKSDMPIIMSSLAEEFHKSLPGDEYLAGMWKGTLPQALAWSTIQFWPEGDKSSIAPTWSWLSAPAPMGVSFVKEVSMERLIPLAKVVGVDVVRETGHENDEYGPVKSGTLRLEGFMRKIWFDFDEKGGFELSVVDTLVDEDEDDNSKCTLRKIGKNWDEQEGEVCELEFDWDVRAEHEEYCCWCMFTSIEEWMDHRNVNSHNREIVAILLRRSDDDDNTGWVRMGTMKMKDLIAFNMRYKACWQLDTDLDEEGDEKNKAGQFDKQDNRDDDDVGKPQEVQQKLEENNNPIDTTSEGTPDNIKTTISEALNPQIEQCPPKTKKTTASRTENTTTSEPDHNSKTQPNPNPESAQTKSSKARTDPWPRLAHFVQRKRFAKCQAEDAAKEALKEKTASDNDIIITEATTTVTSPPPSTSHTNTNTAEDFDPTPIGGHQSLDPTTFDPALALYQFDNSLAKVQGEGYFKWLRRLDVRKIELV